MDLTQPAPVTHQDQDDDGDEAANAVVETPVWITYLQAAQLIGCDPATVANMVRDGRLTRRLVPRRYPAIDRASAEAMAAIWQERAARRTPARQPNRDRGRPPTTEEDWITAREAAALLGLTTSALHARCRQDHLRSVLHGGQRWLRRTDVQIAINVKAFHAQARRASTS